MKTLIRLVKSRLYMALFICLEIPYLEMLLSYAQAESAPCRALVNAHKILILPIDLKD